MYPFLLRFFFSLSLVIPLRLFFHFCFSSVFDSSIIVCSVADFNINNTQLQFNDERNDSFAHENYSHNIVMKLIRSFITVFKWFAEDGSSVPLSATMTAQLKIYFIQLVWKVVNTPTKFVRPTKTNRNAFLVQRKKQIMNYAECECRINVANSEIGKIKYIF